MMRHRRTKDRLSMARRHVAEGEEHVARQEILIAKLDRDGHSKLAVQARALLATLRTSLRLTYRGLRTSPGDQVSPSEAGPIYARIPEFSPHHAQRVGANHDRGSQGIALVAALPLMLVRGVDNIPATPHPDEAPAASRSGRGRRVS